MVTIMVYLCTGVKIASFLYDNFFKVKHMESRMDIPIHISDNIRFRDGLSFCVGLKYSNVI